MDKQSGHILLPILILFTVISSMAMYSFKNLELWCYSETAAMKLQQQQASIESALFLIKQTMNVNCINQGAYKSQWWQAPQTCHIHVGDKKFAYMVEPLQADVCVVSGNHWLQFWRINIHTLKNPELLLQATILYVRFDSSQKCRHYISTINPSALQSWRLS